MGEGSGRKAQIGEDICICIYMCVCVCVCMLYHAVVQQKLTQHCKAIAFKQKKMFSLIMQLKHMGTG